MESFKLGDDGFENTLDIYNVKFENYLASNYNCPSAYDDVITENELFSPPSLEEKIEYDYNMPPIYDDYNDESGFGDSMTLGSINPTSLDSVKSYDNIVKSGFGDTMTLSNDNPTILESSKN